MSSISAEAERAGFESVWIVEGTGTDAFVASTEIALNTSTIRIGTDIVSTFTRHPCVLASASASVDMVAKGRFRLGLGASHQSIVENQLGLSFTKPIKRMEETIQILTKIFASREPISFNGEIFAISNYSLSSGLFANILTFTLLREALV